MKSIQKLNEEYEQKGLAVWVGQAVNLHTKKLMAVQIGWKNG